MALPSGTCKRRKFIIDTDAGLDDAQAIMMALAASNVEVVALTTVRGNANAKQVTINLLRLLKVIERLEVPVYRGCEDMLLGWRRPSEYNYHGHDGFGDVHDPDTPDQNLLQSKHAVQALVDLSKEYEGEISLIAIGPQTNVAMAIRMDQDFGKRLKSCFIMGGNYRAKGNVTSTGEFNFYSDPEAAHIVLNHLGCPITLVSWELCYDLSLSWDTYQELRQYPSEKCQFLKQLESLMVSNCKKNKWPKYIPCDELAVACAVDDSVVTRSHQVYASVELHGQLTRGQMVVDWNSKLGKQPNIRLVTGINTDLYKDLLVKAVV